MAQARAQLCSDLSATDPSGGKDSEPCERQKDFQKENPFQSISIEPSSPWVASAGELSSSGGFLQTKSTESTAGHSDFWDGDLGMVKGLYNGKRCPQLSGVVGYKSAVCWAEPAAEIGVT